MSPAMLGFTGIIALLALLALRIPVALATGGIAIAGFALSAVLSDAGMTQTFATIPPMLSDVLQADVVAMVMLFVTLGNIAFYAGISTRIYDAAQVWLRAVPGGLAMASVLGCGGFAAISGSSVGCASTMGRICVPEMLRHGYDPRLATSSVAVGGTLGSLIPPSVLFILYGLLSGQPIARLFIAGLLPGLLSLAGMLAVILWWIREEPGIAPDPGPAGASRAEATLALWPPLVLLAIIIGGLYSGLLSPLTAAAVCVGIALAIGVLHHRLSAAMLWIVFRDSAVQGASLLLIVVTATLFLGLVQQSGAGMVLAEWARFGGLPALTVVALAAAACLVLGMFIEPLGILVLAMPVMVPLMQVYGMDPIWFGVILVKLLEIALITPPVGLNVFVIGSVTRDIAVDRIFAGVARFLLVDMLVLVVLILFPVLSTLLPASMTL
ncbi:TRAP transporter large permease [Paracoccus methylarcula]|uniref:TRAP transporter large permease n=1 Tax=Paracoccus methylarcula TaxID=72022 RepID=A0A422QZ43_9RHOB|nr:TRAP transporter large permease [Paracoccus methylarcula]RNF35180.1 TRAP transporter large permease [Paracoccus methylarcula]